MEIHAAIAHGSVAVLSAVRPDQRLVAELGDPLKGSRALGRKILHADLQSTPIIRESAREWAAAASSKPPGSRDRRRPDHEGEGDLSRAPTISVSTHPGAGSHSLRLRASRLRRGS